MKFQTSLYKEKKRKKGEDEKAGSMKGNPLWEQEYKEGNWRREDLRRVRRRESHQLEARKRKKRDNIKSCSFHESPSMKILSYV